MRKVRYLKSKLPSITSLVELASIFASALATLKLMKTANETVASVSIALSVFLIKRIAIRAQRVVRSRNYGGWWIYALVVSDAECDNANPAITHSPYLGFFQLVFDKEVDTLQLGHAFVAGRRNELDKLRGTWSSTAVHLESDVKTVSYVMDVAAASPLMSSSDYMGQMHLREISPPAFADRAFEGTAHKVQALPVMSGSGVPNTTASATAYEHDGIVYATRLTRIKPEGNVFDQLRSSLEELGPSLVKLAEKRRDILLEEMPPAIRHRPSIARS